MEQVKVWGDLGCFTRPEFGVERVSYEVMTPSAARGVLEAIFWKPEFRREVREIHVLKPIRRYSILRNEINSRQSHRRKEVYYADEDRSQRHTLMLRDVAYIIKGYILPRDRTTASLRKFSAQFRRRVARGACFTQPYLGTRECTAFFGEVEGDEEPINVTDDLGRMLLQPGYTGGPPAFFNARLENGVLHVPRLEVAA